MSVSSKTLYISENGDRCDLRRNIDGRLAVRHTGNIFSGAHVTDIGLDAFLAPSRNGPEHQAMWRLIDTLLDEDS